MIMNRQIAIAQILPDLYEGGVERGTVDLGKYLVENNFRSMVISGGGPMVAQLEENGVRHLAIEVGKKRPSILFSIKKLRDFFLSEKIDIVHARSRVPAWAALLALKSIEKKLRPKFITTFHGYYSVNKYSAIMTKGEVVIAVSDAIKQHIIDEYKIAPGKVNVIHRGVDPNVFYEKNVTNERRHQLLEKWNLDLRGELLLMMPGRISEWKGQDIFIKSLALIKEIPWKAVIVGSYNIHSDYVKRLHALAEQFGIIQRIQFVGSCKDMPAAYSLADVVVSASSGQPEAFGRIAIEAQSMQTPIIATAHGGSLETVIDNVTGWLVAPGDHIDMAKKIQVALGSKEARFKVGLCGRENVLANYSLREMCGKTVDIYRNILTR
ncbi:MAG: glycosyltransferase family 4 protein [Desulfobulbus sp.]|nr:glycosyltransferase family 4 protein [Desulfobulbus sp.]